MDAIVVNDSSKSFGNLAALRNAGVFGGML